MKTILVLTDFSEHAFYALKVAGAIARRVHAVIRVVHACDLPTIGAKQSAYYEDFYNEIKENARDQLGMLAKSKILSDVQVETFLVTDKTAWRVSEDPKFGKADLILIGSHGKSGLNRMIIGSNADKIVRMSEAPVLTIKNEPDDFSIKRMVLASDFREDVVSVYKKIKFLITAYRPELYLLKVITPSDFESTPLSFRLMHDFIQMNSLKKCSINIFNGYSIESGIIDFNEQIGADLVAIPTHGRTGFSHLINGSLAESLAKLEPKPVLSVKMPEEPEIKVEKKPPESIYQHLEFF